MRVKQRRPAPTMAEVMRTDEDLHSGHLDAIRELRSHPGFDLHEGRILQMIQMKRNELESDKDPEHTWKLRGYIAALRDVLTIPEILTQELEQKLKSSK